MIYKTIKESKFTVLTLYELNKAVRALYRERLYSAIPKLFLRNIKLMTLPYILNLSKYLTVEQMYDLQTTLSYVNETDREKRFKKIEEILSDYGLPVETLTKKQIIGFANFVNNL